MLMRLTIKEGTKTNGAGATRAADPAATSATARDGAKRPVLATVLRSIDGTAADMREALLQLLSGATPYVPRIRVRETSEAIVVTGRVPHVDEDSVEVTLDGRTLRVRGEKSSQRERTRRAYRSVWKVHRTFERTIPLDCDIDLKNVVATLRDGLLRIHVPRKHPSPEESKSIPLDSDRAGVVA
jgi:HSP20 family protein